LNVFFDSKAAMQAMILMANDQANQILYNSAIGFRFRVVKMVFLNSFNEDHHLQTRFQTMLDWLTNPSDGNLDQAQTLRAQYSADEVILVHSAREFCGMAWLNRDLSPDLAYASYNAGCLNGRVWAHELGHTFGCFHDRFSDSSASTDNPNYLGFGSCWEDASKNDCTCYSSTMIYQCDTLPNHCTSCNAKNYMANYLVTDSGSATGTTTASCGLWMDQNKAVPQNYFHSIQPGGIIQSVSPNFAIGITCSLVNISGWQLSITGNDITSVTLGGQSTTIVEQSVNYVMVLTPVNKQSTNIAGDVVVTTSTGRVTTVPKSFTFVQSTFTDFESFKSLSLPAGIWSNAGTKPWSFQSDERAQPSIWKDATGSPDDFVDLRWSSASSSVASHGGCTAIASRIKFAYRAYSGLVDCYDKFQLRAQQNGQPTWTVAWNAQISSTVTPWQYVDIVLPSQTTGLSIFASTRHNDGCQPWSPGEMKRFNLTVSPLISIPIYF
jgi:hypothetical protein